MRGKNIVFPTSRLISCIPPHTSATRLLLMMMKKIMKVMMMAMAMTMATTMAMTMAMIMAITKAIAMETPGEFF